MVKINGRWYIFYHRHTNGKQFSRQGCAEPITILPDGSIQQVEITSCGLNGGSLSISQKYSAHICCNLIGPNGATDIDATKGFPETEPIITEENTGNNPNQYVHNLQKDAVCGVKYLDFSGEKSLTLTLRGKGTVEIRLNSENGAALCFINVDSKDWIEITTGFIPVTGKHAVYFACTESDKFVDFSEFMFQ